MKSFLRLPLIALCSAFFIIGCVKRIDSTSNETYTKSLSEIKSELSQEEKDSLELCILAIAVNEEYSILESDEIINRLDGMSAADILSEGGQIIKRAQFIQDSTRKAFVADSIEMYEAQGLWTIQYFVDDFQQQTKNGYLKQVCNGSFSNSAVTNAKLIVQFLITNDWSAQIFLYEYGNQPVKNNFRYAAAYDVKLNNAGKVVNLRGVMQNDRITFPGSNNSTLIQELKNGGIIKFLVVEDEEYGVNSKYLFQIDTYRLDETINSI
jgi:hypothetical protein